jgi:hypothetical protein
VSTVELDQLTSDDNEHFYHPTGMVSAKKNVVENGINISARTPYLELNGRYSFNIHHSNADVLWMAALVIGNLTIGEVVRRGKKVAAKLKLVA